MGLKLDADKDGFVSQSELRDRCIEWHIPTSEAQRVIDEADRDAVGALDFDMFAKRFGGTHNWGSRGVHKGQALAPHRTLRQGLHQISCQAAMKLAPHSAR